MNLVYRMLHSVTHVTIIRFHCTPPPNLVWYSILAPGLYPLLKYNLILAYRSTKDSNICFTLSSIIYCK